MDWTISIIFLAIGAVIGFVISQMKTKNQADNQALEAKLHQAQTELAQYRQDVADHFANSASLMKQMASDYSKIYQHMQQSQEMLLPDAEQQHANFQDDIAAESLEAPLPEETPKRRESDQPNDYVLGSHGIINQAEKTNPQTVS